MKKYFLVATLVFIGFISMLWIEKPLKVFLSSIHHNPLTAKYLSAIFVRLVLIYLGYLLVKKLRFEKFIGLDRPNSFKNIQAIYIPLTFIFLGISINWNNYFVAENIVLCLFILDVLVVGIVEELGFRGIVFPLCIKAMKDVKRPILTAAIVSSSFFGFLHFVNLFSQPDNLMGIISQVFFAIAIGVFFCGLMVRTENILIPIIIHALINFSFGSSELLPVTESISHIKEESSLNWNSIIPTTLFFAFIMAGGVYMILKSDINATYEKLGVAHE